MAKLNYLYSGGKMCSTKGEHRTIALGSLHRGSRKDKFSAITGIEKKLC